MCLGRYSSGLVQDTGSSVAFLASTAAHELGHILNMEHDDGRKYMLASYSYSYTLVLYFIAIRCILLCYFSSIVITTFYSVFCTKADDTCSHAPMHFN